MQSPEAYQVTVSSRIAPFVLAAATLVFATNRTFAQQHEDFDSYPTNMQVIGHGGWEGWGGSASAGAMVSSAQWVSPSNSIDINGASDLVHQYSGYTSGRWVYRAKQYIPSSMSGAPYFILLSQYPTSPIWAVQVSFNSVSGNVEADAGGATAGATTPIVFDRWVDIDVVIDLTADWVQFYYDGVLLDDPAVPDHPVLGGGWAWTKGPFGADNGPLDIAAVDLFANNATSIYYDEVSLQRETKWREDFDTYAAGSQAIGQGGWDGWGSSAAAGALVSSMQSFGPGHSIDVNGATDLVHQYSGYTSGQWEYHAKLYIPSGMTGSPYFILLSQYPTNPIWAVQVAFNSVTGNVEADAGGATAGATTPIVFDRWVDIQVMIDFDADWVQLYYDNTLLDDPAVPDHPVLGGGWAWTKGPFGADNGPLDIAAVDLFANNATSIYYDDISLCPALAGVRNYGEASPGSSGSAHIYALDHAIAPSSTFGFGCRNAPASTAGAFEVALADYQHGLPIAGITVFVDPTPVLLSLPIMTSGAGGHSLKTPLLSGYAGITLYTQYVFLDPNPSGPLSATEGLEIGIQ